MEDRGLNRFVYHLVPEDLRGTVIYPLNVLRTVHPDIAARKLEKYRGREHLLTSPIPPLGCVWNDVIMFSPVHPRDIRAALAEAGDVRPLRKWLEVGAVLFSPADTALYLPGDSPQDERFESYEPGCLERYARLPEAQRRYYRAVAPGKAVMLFGAIPHVLYRGTVDLRSARVIEA